MPLSDRVARGVKATFGARVIDIVANAALTVVLARYLLSTDQYGQLYIAISVIGVASILGSLGIPSSTARYVAEYVEKDASQVPSIIVRSLAYLVVLCGAVNAGLFFGAPLIARVLDAPEMAVLLMTGVLYVTFYALSKFLTKIFQAFNRVSLSAMLNSISAVGRLVFAVLLVLAGLGTTGALLGYVAGFAAASGVGVWLLYTRFYRSFDAATSMERGLSRRILEYSIPLTATRTAAIVDKKVDTILVGAILGATPAAFYTIAKQVSDACVAPASALGFTISPSFGEDKAGDRLERAARRYERSMEHVLVLYIPAVVGLVLVAEPMVVHVFGPRYRGAVPVVQVLGLFVLAEAVNSITSDGLDYLGRARSRAVAKTAMAIGNLLLNLLLIPTIGVVGAAIATVITFSAYTIYNVTVIATELPIELRTVARSATRVGIVSAGMGMIVIEIRPFIAGIPSLLAVVGIGVAIWAVGSASWGLIDPKRVRSFLSMS